ncbi:MAG TPA: lysylphosphatidylglycerol synthase domain-containing protein [Candidatus Sulfotelmatobacter sp.]|nr:lysylphosphatidylglycerol synthase domain-containing protein [Candidatus Sulfotelmatobacter sp.]
MFKKYRPYISVGLLVILLGYGGYYIYHNRSLFSSLKTTSLATITKVYLLYWVILAVLVLIFFATLKICSKRISLIENLKLNIHTVLINFFVPGQGGPAYRGGYMYKVHNLKIKKYILSTLIYYGIYAVLSFMFLFAFKFKVWQTILLALLVAGFSFLVISRYSKKSKLRPTDLHLSSTAMLLILLATLLQLVVQSIIFGIELHSVNPSIHESQIISYTGAANLTLFAALTPGAIGIREAFLVFTQHIHHISTANIIAANIIDRSVYIVFLLTLAVLIGGYHAYKRYSSRQKLSLGVE